MKSETIMRATGETISAAHARRSVHVWVPGLGTSKGGIETYSAFLLRALDELNTEISLTVFSKHDRTRPSVAPRVPFRCAGGSSPRSRTPRFAAQIFCGGLYGRPDLIIAAHINFAPVARALKKLIGVPYWIVAYGVESWDIRQRQLRAALRDADKVLAISDYTRGRMLAGESLDARRANILPVTLAHEGFDIGVKPAHLLQRYGLSCDQPVILTVARLVSGEQYKGYDNIIKALPDVRRKIPSVRYLLVGKGDDRARIERLIAETGVEDCVTLAGFVPDEELCDHYNLCDAFAMPSKGEGFGIVYLEALACGKPVLGGNRDGAIDALLGGELGALVDPDDTKEIAATLTAILARRYPHPIMYRPEVLRERMLEAYGYERFKENLATLMCETSVAGAYRREVRTAEVEL